MRIRLPRRRNTKTIPAQWPPTEPRLLARTVHPSDVEEMTVEFPPVIIGARFNWHQYNKERTYPLALPWTYYTVRYVTISRVRSHCYSDRAGARAGPVHYGTDDIFALPVPNSHWGGYLCLGGYETENLDHLTPLLRAIRAVNDFWAGLFTYHDDFTDAHRALEVRSPGLNRTIIPAHRFYAPYQHWATWTPEEVLTFPWGFHRLCSVAEFNELSLTTARLALLIPANNKGA